MLRECEGEEVACTVVILCRVAAVVGVAGAAVAVAVAPVVTTPVAEDRLWSCARL